MGYKIDLIGEVVVTKKEINPRKDWLESSLD
jgi:hypothetical protein